MQFETTPPQVRAKPQNDQGDERRNKNHKYLFITQLLPSVVGPGCTEGSYGKINQQHLS